MTGAGVCPVLMLCPQFVQKALLLATSAWQAGHCLVAGCTMAVTGALLAASACAPSELPQCIQKAALVLTLPLQRGQLVVAASAGIA